MSVIATADAVSDDSRSPTLGRPKKMKNSCTMNGVLRISSTYAAATARSHAGPCVRARAQATPSATPSSVETAVSPSVNAAPRSSSGQSTRTAAKSSWIIVLLRVRLQ